MSRFSSFFCISNVIATLSADSKSADCVGMRHPSLKLMFVRHKILVCFYSRLGTFEYSHDLQAKQTAPIVSCTIKSSVSVTTWHFANLLRTENGRAFCCFSVGSLFLKAQNCLDRRMRSSLSASLVGFCLPNDRKVCTTFDMIPLPVASTSVLNCESENLLLLTAMTNASSRRILSSVKMSWHLAARKYSSHLAQVQDLSSCVNPVTPFWWVSAVEAKSAKGWYCWKVEISWNALASVMGGGYSILRWVLCCPGASPKRVCLQHCSVFWQTIGCIFLFLHPWTNERGGGWCLHRPWLEGVLCRLCWSLFFCIHPLPVALLVINRVQSLHYRRLASRSI